MYIEDHKVARSWIATIYAQKECRGRKNEKKPTLSKTTNTMLLAAAFHRLTIDTSQNEENILTYVHCFKGQDSAFADNTVRGRRR